MKKFFLILVVFFISCTQYDENNSSFKLYDEYDNSINKVEEGFGGEENSENDIVDEVDNSDSHTELSIPSTENEDFENYSINQNEDNKPFIYFLDHNPYGDSFQCDRCGELSQSHKKPTYGNGCLPGRLHQWQYANTMGGYECNKCNQRCHIIKESGYYEPLSGEIGTCYDGSYGPVHSWVRF